MDTESGLTAYVAAELRMLRSRPRPALTFDALADGTGVAKASLKRYFNGHRPIPMDVLDQVAEALGSTAWQIIYDAEVARTTVTRIDVGASSDTAGLDELGVLTKEQLEQRDLGLAAQKDPEEGQVDDDTAGSGA